MAELSKTAKASMIKEIKKAEVETPEVSIRKLRNDLATGLYVPSHRIKVLLDAYDAAIDKIELLENELLEVGEGE